jgi:hypothetical protein
VLDLEVEVGVLAGDVGRDLELGVEGGRRQRGQAGRGLAALGQGREEGDVERVRQAEHVRDEPVVALQIHLDQGRHGRGEQLAGGAGGLAVADVDEDDVAAAEQLGVGTEHGVDRRDPAAGGAQRMQPRAQRALERADVEDHAARRRLGQLVQDLAGDGHGRGHHDQLVIERERPPVGHRGHAVDGARRIGDLDREALGRQETHEPAAHAAGAADHQHPPPAAGALGRDPVALLHRERLADERQHQLLAQRRRQALGRRRRPCPLDDIALLPEVAHRHARRPLDPPDLLRRRLPPRRQPHQLLVDRTQLGPQFVQRAHGAHLTLAVACYHRRVMVSRWARSEARTSEDLRRLTVAEAIRIGESLWTSDLARVARSSPEPRPIALAIALGIDPGRARSRRAGRGRRSPRRSTTSVARASIPTAHALPPARIYSTATSHIWAPCTGVAVQVRS